MRRRFFRLPIKQKLIVLSVVVAGSALFLFSLVSAFNQVRIMRRAMVENLTIISETVADLSIAVLSFSDTSGAEEILSTLRADSDIEVAALYTEDDRVFAAYFRDGDKAQAQRPEDAKSGEVRFFFQNGKYFLEISRPVHIGDKALGTLYLLSNSDRMVGHIINSVVLLLVSVFVVLAVTVLISAKLQGVITKPVRILAGTARRISERGDYSLRVKKSSDDEIGQLIDDFNTMLKGIQERDLELQKHRQNLQLLVDERTEELRAKRDEALAAARAKSEFLANMSHEIRTPMNGVIGVLSLLQDVPMDAEYKRLLDTATRSADSLLLVINDILDFSKIDAGKITFESIHFDLRELMEETSELFIDLVNVKKLELTCFVPSHIPCHLQGDPTRLRQILTNLLSNAVKFTEKGEVRLGVSVIRREENRQELLFTVEDTGIGIAEAVTGKLFEKFTQADGSTTRKYGGTGLGLSVCKQLVEQQGGGIGVSSRIGSGSSFWFTLTFDIVEDSYPIIPCGKLKGKFYLLVEDSPTSRAIIEHYLQVCDSVVVSCTDGGSCLTRLSELMEGERTVDGILIDQRLPDGEGLDLAGRIGRNYGEKAPPVVIMSTTTFTKARLRRAGVSRSLLKPIRRMDLYNSLVSSTEGLTASRRQQKCEPNSLWAPRLSGSVLLVDDEPINQRIALAILRKFGLQAEVANSGRQAIQMIAKNDYTVVLMDIQMPEMSGYEATERIRHWEKEGGHKRTVIIAMTANAMPATRNRCFEAGMDDFFTKPIKPDVLQERLASWLKKEETQGVVDESTEDSSAQQQAVQGNEMDDVLGSAELWQVDKALEFVGGDEGLLQDLASLFIDRSNILMTAIGQALESGNGEALRDAAHAYKGAVGHFAAEEVRGLALELEYMGKKGELVGAEKVYERLQQRGERLLDELGGYLERMRE